MITVTEKMQIPNRPTLCKPEEWVDQHGDYLFRYALLRLRDRHLAEEVVQETFLAAFQGKDKFSGRSSERTWLVGILKHKVIDYFRRISKEVPWDENKPLPCELEEPFRVTGEWIGHWKEEEAPIEWNADPVRLLEQKEFRQVFERSLAMLPQRLAQVFILREVEELTSDEICKILNISESNLWVMLHRARMQLRRSLEQQYFRSKTQKTK